MKKAEKDISYYYDRNRFWQLFFRMEKYKDLYSKSAATLSFLLSVVTLFIFFHVLYGSNSVDLLIFSNLTSPKLPKHIDDVMNLIRSILPTLIGGYFSFLGFLIGGLAILSGTMSNKVLANINDEGKTDHLMSIIFNFYFASALMGFTIVISSFTYLATFTNILFNVNIFSIWVILISYFIFLSLIYGVKLVGTCMRFFLLSYRFYDTKKVSKYKIKRKFNL